MDNPEKNTLQMQTLLLCADVQFLGITRSLLNDLHIAPAIVSQSDAALGLIQTRSFDVVIVDWREIDNLAEFLSGVRRSKLNHESVLVAIVRDLLDLRQAFAAGVHFLIHKPASALQIERCLRAAYSATVARRRKQHRETVEILASLCSRNQPLSDVMVVNISEGGVGLKISVPNLVEGRPPGVGEDVGLRFVLPGTDQILEVTGTVMWRTPDTCGVRFRYIPEAQRAALEQWLTECVERSLSEMCERVRSACA